MHKKSWTGPLKPITASKISFRDTGVKRSWNGGNEAAKQKRSALQEASTHININRSKNVPRKFHFEG